MKQALLILHLETCLKVCWILHSHSFRSAAAALGTALLQDIAL
jgi:hypothetical protein